ncbi:MAG: hypothetical protein WD994_06665, partial [Pseudomonadales bacterium]
VDDAPARLASLRTASGDAAVLFSFDHLQYYLQHQATIRLHALCHLDYQSGDLHCLITNDPAISQLVQAQGHIGCEEMNAIGRTLDANVINLREALPLETLRIPKPWGAEVWYTGIESRGVCRVGTTPLPWILALAGDLMHGPADPKPVLLKILDPLPDELYGDLYFEMHAQKIEVYVVTGIDQRAWPDGTGAIRFGFDSGQLERFNSRTEFLDAYLHKVNEYRELRVAIDSMLDAIRAREGIEDDAVVSPETIERWKSEIDPDLCTREQTALTEMNEFTAIKPLEVGDVVRVPNFTPHALQHGVRVVEFQTPHYERYILSFAQKVLTQGHWDTAEALDKVNWDAVFDQTLPTLAHTETFLVEQVADFDAFEVRRIRLRPAASLDIDIDTYSVVMVIDGYARVNGVDVQPEGAVLVPHCARQLSLATNTSEALILLAIARSG